MTWNVHKGIGGLDREYSIERTIAVLRHYAPDVAILQEVAQGIKRLHHHNQVEMISQALGMHAAFHLEHHFRIGAYGNLILSRWPVHHINHVDLTIGWRKKRGALQAHIRTHIDQHQRTLVIHNLHLGLAGSERNQQLRRFVTSKAFETFHQDTASIIAGDLNDLWGNLGQNHLIPIGFARAGSLANTFPSALPLRPLDGIFYRGGLRLIHSAVARSKLAKTASDHLPLYADFEFI